MQKLAQYIRSNWALTLFLVIFAVIFLGAQWERLADFHIMQKAGLDLNKKLAVYEIYYNGFKYYYSPLFATLLSYAPDVDFIWFGWIWKLINLAFLWRTWQIITTYYLGQNLNTKQKNLWVFFSFIACFHLLYDNFHYVQFSIFLIYMSLEGLHQIITKRNIFLGALILSIAINIKIIPIVFLPYLIYRKQFTPVLTIMVLSVVWLILPSTILGWDYNIELLAGWWRNINPLDSIHILDVREAGLHSISSLVSVLFTEEGTTPDVHTRRHLVTLSYEQIKYIILFLRVILVASTLYVLRWNPFKTEQNKEKIFSEWAVILLVAVLIFPHQQIYGFALGFPVMIIMIYYFMTNDNSTKKISFWLFVLAVLIINLAFYFGFARNFLSHYKTMTYGILLLLGLFLSNRSRRFSPKNSIASACDPSLEKDNL